MKNYIQVTVFMMSFDFSKINTKNFVYKKTLQLNPRLMTRTSYINIFYESFYHIERCESFFKMSARRKTSFAQALSSHNFWRKYSRVEKLRQQLAIVMERFIDSPVQMNKEIDKLT